MRSAGGYFGYGGGCDSPDIGRDLDAPGYQAQAWQQHTVSAVSSELAVLDPALLIATLAAHRDQGARLRLSRRLVRRAGPAATGGA
ncbi:MAG: hypothetical protein WDO24_19150 [Pseudomonadota bacterium]